MANRKKPVSKRTELVYGCWNGQLIFVRRVDALYLADRLDALLTSKTWAEIENRLHPDDFKNLCEERRRPKQRGKFNGQFIYEEQSMHWIPDPLASMTSLLPPAVQTRFGRVEGGMDCEPQLFIAETNEAGVVAHLESTGYSVTRDDELVEATFQYKPGRWERLMNKHHLVGTLGAGSDS